MPEQRAVPVEERPPDPAMVLRRLRVLYPHWGFVYVAAFMAALGLRFGAFDFLVTQDGWVFLEVNPNGQWAWIEDHTGLPIAAAIADALTRETR